MSKNKNDKTESWPRYRKNLSALLVKLDLKTDRGVGKKEKA